MVTGQLKMSESSQDKRWLNRRCPNSKNSNKRSKWQITSICVCNAFRYLHPCTVQQHHVRLKSTNEVLHKRYPLGCSHTTCHSRLGKWIYRNPFPDMTLNVQSEGVKWKWDFMALHYRCRSRNWTWLLFFLLLLQGRLNSWYKVHTNMEKAVHAVVLVLVLHPTWPLSTHACLKSGKRGTFYNNHTIAHRIIRCSNNYNLRTAINFGYSRWFLFWLQLYRKVELWESIISLAVLDINTLAANSTDYPAFL